MAEEVIRIKSEWIRAAKLAGACEDAISSVRAGDPLSSLPQDNLIWAEENLNQTLLREISSIPLWALAESGYGDGDGDGYGDGYGSGYGYGDGYGYGYGSGSGYGDGYGYGDE